MKYRNIVIRPVLHSSSFTDDPPTPNFAILDRDGNGLLSRWEVPQVNFDALDHVDADYALVLSEQEYRAYLGFQQRLAKDKLLIPEGTARFTDIAYVSNGHERQKLDLYLPPNRKEGDMLPLVIWVHGGGWQNGTKQLVGRQAFLLEQGFALAAINYRLSSHAAFPAQIHDCKAAVRFLRQNASRYGLDGERIGVWGSSAGGHLAALLGTSGNSKELEGDLGVMGGEQPSSSGL